MFTSKKKIQREISNKKVVCISVYYLKKPTQNVHVAVVGDQSPLNNLYCVRRLGV